MLDPSLENVAAQGEGPVHCRRRSCADLSGDHGWHFHPQFELTLFTHSTGIRYVGDSVARYNPGDLVLSGPNLPHCWRNETVPGGEEARWLTVQFEPDFLGADFMALPEAGGIRQLFEEARRGLAFCGDAARLAESYLAATAELRGLQAMLKLAELLERLTGCDRAQLASSDYHRENVVDQRLVQRLECVNAYVASRFRGLVSQAEIAESLGLSAVAFSKFMRAATGRTFSEIVKLARINEACRLLAGGGDSITEIALECGYQHTSHFDRQFMELKGMTPSEYRRQMRSLAGPASGK